MRFLRYLRFLRYYYYRVFSYYSKGDSVPFLSTFLVIFVVAFFNFLALASIVSIILKINFTFFTVEKGIGRLCSLLFILPLFGIFLHHFKKHAYHDRIIEEFKDETPKQKSKSGLFVILYFVGSLILFIASLWLRDKISGY